MTRLLGSFMDRLAREEGWYDQLTDAIDDRDRWTIRHPSYGPSSIVLRPDLQIIADFIPAGSRVLDLGCGDGALLDYLVHEQGVQGRGIELSEAGVLACVRRGLSVRQGNLQEGLGDYPDRSFDYVVLARRCRSWTTRR